MEINKFNQALDVMRSHELDATDVSIIQFVIANEAEGSTIMQLARTANFAGVGTIVTRIKRMVDRGYLAKGGVTGDLRVRLLVKGEKLAEFLTQLEGV